MPNSEEETYSIIFQTLKHPARRKILRMLAQKPKTFSRILEELGISSSHLTYHIENLGELITKLDDGKYILSSFGRAAVETMKGVEETPEGADEVARFCVNNTRGGSAIIRILPFSGQNMLPELFEQAKKQFAKLEREMMENEAILEANQGRSRKRR